MEKSYKDFIKSKELKSINDGIEFDRSELNKNLFPYTNKGDVVFTPFMGIGSEVYQSVKMERRGIGIELKPSYFDCAVDNMKSLEIDKAQMTIFDFMGISDVCGGE